MIPRILNLLFLTSWCPFPPDNGARLRVFHLLEQLSGRHQIVLVTFSGRGGEPESPELERLCKAVHVVKSDPFATGRLRFRGLLSAVPRSNVQTFSPEVVAHIRQHAGSLDVLVLFGMTTAMYLGSVDRVPSIIYDVEPSVIYEQTGRETHPAYRLRRWLTWMKSRAYFRAIVQRAAAVTVVSDVEKDHFERIGCDPKRVAVVPNGAPTAHLGIDVARTPDTIVYPGSVTYSPNLDAVRYFAHEIWPRVRVARPDARFLVTGRVDGVDLSDFSRVPGVTFTGQVPDVRSLVASSRVCIVPLREGGGTRTKIIEAMALGTPVVSTSKGAEGLAVSSGRDILMADAPQAFADQVVRLLEDDRLVESISSRGRTLVAREYTWEAIAERFERVLLNARDSSPCASSS
jgi:glycosyltransferase involved in cell wall biosynthesis